MISKAKVFDVKKALLCLLFLPWYLFTTPWVTSWVEYPSDPVYTPYPTVTTYPTVAYDGNQFAGHGGSYYYKMWHQNANGITISYSNDGINWVLGAVTNLVGNYYHPCVVYDENGFGGGPYYYKLWLWDGTASATPSTVLYTASVDGITWLLPVPATQGDPPIVVGTGPSYFFHCYGPASVMYNPDAASIPGAPYTYPYVMLYNAASEAAFPGLGIYGVEQLALAYSDDGIDWIRTGVSPDYPPIVVPTNDDAAWDGRYTYQATMIVAQDGYHLFYSGSNDITSVGVPGYANGIGHAYSDDGLTWTKDPDNPIFRYTDGVAWRTSRSYTPWVLNTISGSCSLNKMWFTGANSSVRAVGYATSEVCFAPNPPTNFIGTFSRNEFLTGTEYVLRMTWTASSSENIVLYVIYKNNSVVGRVLASRGLFLFVACLRSESDGVGYEISAVDASGGESERLPLVIV